MRSLKLSAIAVSLSMTEDICDDGDCNDISVMLDAAENSLTSVEMKITITFTN